MKRTLNIVGCGRVGQTLARLLHTSGACEILDITGGDMGRTLEAARFIQAGRPVQSLAEMRPADLWILTVPDTRIRRLPACVGSIMRRTGADDILHG